MKRRTSSRFMFAETRYERRVACTICVRVSVREGRNLVLRELQQEAWGVASAASRCRRPPACAQPHAHPHELRHPVRHKREVQTPLLGRCRVGLKLKKTSHIVCLQMVLEIPATAANADSSGESTDSISFKRASKAVRAPSSPLVAAAACGHMRTHIAPDLMQDQLEIHQ